MADRSRYLIEGSVIPERVDLSISKFSFAIETTDNSRLDVSLEIIKSKIFIHVDAPKETGGADIRNVVSTAIGSLINFAGFRQVIGISYEINSITDVDEKRTYVYGAEGFVFDDTTEFGELLTFRADKFGESIRIENPAVVVDPAVSRATFELRNSIRYPDFTALHCRLAIEAIRNAFNADDESLGWKLLRENLNVKRDTIESFKDVATAQRHGRNVPQTWQQRRRCMQIAWEICARFIRYLGQTPQTPLSDLQAF